MGSTVVTIGTFDGIHIGHQAILQRTGEIGQAEHAITVAYTFALPPRFAIESRGKKRYLLLPDQAKRKLLQQYVAKVEQTDFMAVQHLSAKQFVRQILQEELVTHTVVVGEHFRFGHKREGDVNMLQRIGKDAGIEVIVVPSICIHGTLVSSTHIRSLITVGEIEDACAFLGRPPLLIGKVSTGDHLGQKLGYPTANLVVDPSVLLPGDGIYLAHAFWSQGQGAGLVYIGTRPTLKKRALRCEIHLLSSPKEPLLEKVLELHLLKKLRDDHRFPSLEDLRLQIAKDIAQARTLLPAYNANPKPILA
jgi:riboflavin kinase/FMN adenylyltransferase